MKRQRLRTQMAATNSYNLQLKIATRLDGLADQIIVLEKDTKVENGIKAARAKYHAARELFIEQVIKLRKTQKQVKEKYADLAANNEIKKAIDTYNETADKKIKLGPSRGFLVSLKKAKALEDSVLSGTIKLREEHDSLYVNAVFNGHYSHELVLDTGATSTALSWATAKKLGLTPGPGARQIKLQLADGRLVDGYSVMAKSIRVGKFTVKNVEVVVFEQRLIKASDLLGISFLKHFNYKIDSTTHKLVMSKVETKADKRARESEEKENSKSKN